MAEMCQTMRPLDALFDTFQPYFSYMMRALCSECTHGFGTINIDAVVHMVRLGSHSLELNTETADYSDVIMGAMASQITSLMIVYSGFYPGADQRKHQSFASLAFVRGIHRRPVNSPHKWPVTRKMFLFDDVIMRLIDINTGTVEKFRGISSDIQNKVNRDPFYQHGLTLISAWICNYIHHKVWDEITSVWCNRWSLEMDRSFYPILYWKCEYLFQFHKYIYIYIHI